MSPSRFAAAASIARIARRIIEAAYSHASVALAARASNRRVRQPCLDPTNRRALGEIRSFQWLFRRLSIAGNFIVPGGELHGFCQSKRLFSGKFRSAGRQEFLTLAIRNPQ
jgi:hypothetical protein